MRLRPKPSPKVLTVPLPRFMVSDNPWCASALGSAFHALRHGRGALPRSDPESRTRMSGKVRTRPIRCQSVWCGIVLKALHELIYEDLKDLAQTDHGQVPSRFDARELSHQSRDS